MSIVKLNYNTKSDGPEYELAGTYNHDAVLPWSDAPVAETNKEKIKYNLRYLFILLEIAKEDHIFQQNQMSKVSSEFMNSQDTVN